MGLDVIKIYREGLRSNMHPTDGCSFEEAIFFNGFSCFKYVEVPQNRNLSYYYLDEDGIYLKYSPYINKGELRIKFNIPKLIAGTNAASIFTCNIQQVFERICFKLWPYIDLAKAPHIRFWKVSNVEINIDIILETAKINAIYDLLIKTSSTNKYTQIDTYDDGAGGKSIYFIPKRASFKSSDTVIKFYYKIPEMKAHNDNFCLNDIYNSYGIANLKAGQSILRIELELKRDKINEIFKKQEQINPANDDDINLNIGTLEQIFNFNYQYKVMNQLIREFNLDKAIVTENKLKDIINNAPLSLKDKKDFWYVIQYLNKNNHRKKPLSRIIKKCIKFINMSGYNYLYVDTEVEPIRIDDIIKALPEVQQREIATYKESNIFKDMLFYKSTPQRIYKGKRY